jgi:hypothetical protein
MADTSVPAADASAIDWLRWIASNPSSANSSESLASLLLGVGWSLAAVSAAIVALRLYTAARILGRVKIEDYFMVMAWVSSVCTIPPQLSTP